MHEWSIFHIKTENFTIQFCCCVAHWITAFEIWLNCKWYAIWGCRLAILDSSIKLNRIIFIVSHTRTHSFQSNKYSLRIRARRATHTHTNSHFLMIYCNKCIPSSGISNLVTVKFTHIDFVQFVMQRVRNWR